MPTVQPASRNYFKALVAFMWVALPVIGFRSWQVWGQLPARLITHFNRAGRPNGWMTPQQSLIFSLGLTLFLLIPFTAIDPFGATYRLTLVGSSISNRKSAPVFLKATTRDTQSQFCATTCRRHPCRWKRSLSSCSFRFSFSQLFFCARIGERYFLRRMYFLRRPMVLA